MRFISLVVRPATGYTLALLLLLGVGLVSHRSLNRLVADEAWVGHTQEVLNHLGRGLSLLQDAETGQRGYLLTADTAFLAPLRRARHALPANQQALVRLTADNADQQLRLDTLRQLTTRRLAILAAGLAHFGRTRAVDVARLRQGKAVMDQARAVLARLAATERRLLARRRAQSQRSARRTLGLIGALTGLALLLAGLASGLLHRTRQVRRAAQADADARTREAEDSRTRFRQLLESIPNMAWTAQPDGLLDYYNQQWYDYTGLGFADLAGINWQQHIHPDDFAATAAAWQHALATGEPLTMLRNRWQRAADGQYRWHLVRAVPLRDEATGAIRLWVGTNTDIDDLEQAQRQLAEKDQLLTGILSSLPASVVTFEGEDLRYGFFNEAYQQLVQGRAVLGRPAAELFPEAEEQGLLALLHQVLRTGEPHQAQEVPVYARDPQSGQQEAYLYLDLAYLPLRYGQQPPHAVLNFVVDATDRVLARRQAEAAQALALTAAAQTAAQREALYQVFKQTPALVQLLREPDHRVEYVNPAYQQLFPGRQLLGRTVAEALPEVAEQGFVRLLDGVYQTGEPYFGQEVLVVMAQPDGQSPRDAYFDFTYQAVREAGRIVGISVFGFEVTERVRGRRQREAQQAQLHNLFMQAPAPIVVLDGPALTYQLVNPAYQRIFPGRQLLGLPLLEALPELEGHEIIAILQNVQRTGVTYVAQETPLLLARYEGGPLEEIFLTFTYQARRDEHGAVDGALAFAYEVTDQVRARRQLADANADLTAANQQLTRVNADLDTFVYTASHDLKTPIHNIEGLLRELQLELAPLPVPADATTLLALMHGAVDRFKGTLGQLTDIAKLQHSSELPTAAIDVAALVEDVRQDLRPLLAATGGQLHLDVAACPQLAFAEKNLRSVVYNLLSNALKYRHPHRVPVVWLRTHPAPADGSRSAVLEVEDNGLGLALGPEQERRLFGLFERLHDHVEGSGVGLFTVKKMVENAGGRIEVSSQLGQGTLFRLHLPMPRPVAKSLQESA